MTAVESNVFNGPILGMARTPPVPSSSRIIETAESVYEQGRLNLERIGRANPEFALTSRANSVVGGEKIFRGYIRRSEVDAADPTSPYRLYFMYNPESLRRSYTAYLDQQSLDPSNAMFGSNNMASAPGIVDFGFDLLFDRHLEVATSQGHPGTKVDYDFFDLVVRGVLPDSSSIGNAVPDNGIMMVNPSNLTVVFGQYLAVRGRAYNASVRFEKFNHRMIPTRMRISIAMKALYVGPVASAGVAAVDASVTKYSSTVEYSKLETNFEESTSEPLFLRQPLDEESTGFYNPFIGSSNGLGPINEGTPPSGIPRGPFSLMIVRSGYESVDSPVSPITLTGDQVLSIVRSLWSVRDRAVEAWAIAAAESGFRANVAGVNSPGTDNESIDIGLFQINSIHYGNRPPNYFTDPWVNAMEAFKVSSEGTNWNPWSVWKYKTVDLDAAYAFFDSRNA